MAPAAVARRLTTGVALLAATALWTSAAKAQTDYCSYLRAQLAAAGGGGNNAANTQALYQQLAIASAQANNLGCQRGFFFFGGGGQHPQCPALLNRVEQLRYAISSAQRGSGGFFGGNPADGIRREMARANCSEEPGWSGGYGGRTVCVRVCDGYYFPISNSGGRSRAKQDEKTCDSVYPNGQAQLFIDDGGQADIDVDRMVTPEGKRYRDQPYALAYRSSYNPACPSPRFTGASIASGTIAPVPAAKPRPSEDPETLANAEGDFALERVAPTVISGTDPATREVRVVGPSYYYAVTGAPPAGDGEKPAAERQASDGAAAPNGAASTARLGSTPAVQ